MTRYPLTIFFDGACPSRRFAASQRPFVLWFVLGIPTEEATAHMNVANSRRDEGKVWWSQRDSNPCLSLERTDQTEEYQQDDASDKSDE
jgi:hypothetical protein